VSEVKGPFELCEIVPGSSIIYAVRKDHNNSHTTYNTCLLSMEGEELVRKEIISS